MGRKGIKIMTSRPEAQLRTNVLTYPIEACTNPLIVIGREYPIFIIHNEIARIDVLLRPANVAVMCI